jgi:hypothetical protein
MHGNERGTEVRASKSRIEQDHEASKQDEADNWQGKDHLKSERSSIDDDRAPCGPDKSVLEKARWQEAARKVEQR